MSDFSVPIDEGCIALPPVTDSRQKGEELARESRYDRNRLAKLLGVSVRTLDRHFQRQMSLSVCQWLINLRMADAYQQVVTGKAFKEISYDLGFKQRSHFTRRFKERFGVPPSLLCKTSPVVPMLAARPKLPGIRIP